MTDTEDYALHCKMQCGMYLCEVHAEKVEMIGAIVGKIVLFLTIAMMTPKSAVPFLIVFLIIWIDYSINKDYKKIKKATEMAEYYYRQYKSASEHVAEERRAQNSEK